jgi:hypothetical protein
MTSRRQICVCMLKGKRPKPDWESDGPKTLFDRSCRILCRIPTGAAQRPGVTHPHGPIESLLQPVHLLVAGLHTHRRKQAVSPDATGRRL